MTADVPDHALVVGVPARHVGWMCACGERLRDAESGAACAACGRSFRCRRGAADRGERVRVPLFDGRREFEADRDDLMRAAEEVLASGEYILGERVRRFEDEVARYVGGGHAVGVASGTDALTLSLKAAGVGPGDRVLTTPFSFFATAGAIVNAGAEPVFADIEPETLNLDPANAREVLERGRRSRPIVPGAPLRAACRPRSVRRARSRVRRPCDPGCGAGVRLEVPGEGDRR